MPTPRIFVSHSHQDNEWCRAFVAGLQAAQLDAWYDEKGLRAGAAWVKAIQIELQACDLFLLVLTPAAWASEWVQDEVQLALATRRRIVVVLHEPTTADGFILARQWVKVVGLTPTEAAQLVARELAAILTPSVPTAPTVPPMKSFGTPAASATPEVRPDDPNWLRQRLTVLVHLDSEPDGREEARELAERIAARPDATAADWLAFAHALSAAPPSRADANDVGVRDRITRTLAFADELARRSQPVDQAIISTIAQARNTLLPAPARQTRSVLPPMQSGRGQPKALPGQQTRTTQPLYMQSLITGSEHFPQRLANLGFRNRPLNSVEVITPPLCKIIPTGRFLMGSNKSVDFQVDDNERPQHPVTLIAYRIGRFPVTVAEYACAVRAGAVKEPPNGGYGSTSWQDQLKQLDHPVVCVSWNDAIAYARWLMKLTGEPWRLPTEAEWEKAARWDATKQVSRIHPWGDTWDKTRANTRDSGLGHTTPVGVYPGGASAFGAHDMAGNVWEWTASLYKAYPFSQAKSNVARSNEMSVRVIRGGSWLNTRYEARTAYRNWITGVSSGNGLGFRLLCEGI